ncbi:hypothetical protein T09_9437 [Trichinella sp. T9]|nr:hypothetical protein T09_9437 [Trichinella sp. T9]
MALQNELARTVCGQAVCTINSRICWSYLLLSCHFLMTLDTSNFKTTTCTVMRLPSLIGTACRRVRTARPRSGPSARVDGRYRNQTLPAVPTSGQPATPPRFTEKYLANFCSHDQLNRWNVKSSLNNIILRESRRREGLYDLTTVPMEQPYDEDRRI